MADSGSIRTNAKFVSEKVGNAGKTAQPVPLKVVGLSLNKALNEVLKDTGQFKQSISQNLEEKVEDMESNSANLKRLELLLKKITHGSHSAEKLNKLISDLKGELKKDSLLDDNKFNSLQRDLSHLGNNLKSDKGSESRQTIDGISVLKGDLFGNSMLVMGEAFQKIQDDTGSTIDFLNTVVQFSKSQLDDIQTDANNQKTTITDLNSQNFTYTAAKDWLTNNGYSEDQIHNMTVTEFEAAYRAKDSAGTAPVSSDDLNAALADITGKEGVDGASSTMGDVMGTKLKTLLASSNERAIQDSFDATSVKAELDAASAKQTVGISLLQSSAQHEKEVFDSLKSDTFRDIARSS